MENEIAAFNEFLEWFSGTRLWARGEFIIKYIIPLCLLIIVLRGIKSLVAFFLQRRNQHRIGRKAKPTYEQDLNEYDVLINTKEKLSNRQK